MNFWKEGLATALIAVLGEKLLIKSNHLPEAFVTVFASTVIAKYLMNMDWNDNRPKFGPENFIGPANEKGKKINPPNRV